MMTLIVGGSASGKSELAESLVVAAGAKKRIYIATMQPFDEECLKRIDKHRAMRATKGFETIECYTDLASVTVPADSVVLLECMSNLCANEFFGPSGAGTPEVILEGVRHVAAQCGQLIIVSNEVFVGGDRYEGETLDYLRALAQVNREVAALADHVCEVVCGLPLWHKGGDV